MSSIRPPAGPRTGFARRKSPVNQAGNVAEDSTAPGSEASVCSSAVDDLESIAPNLEHSSLEHARQKMVDVTRVLQKCPFFALNLLDGTSFDGVSTTNSITIPSAFPREVPAIIIACMLSRKMDVQRYLFELRAAKRPIIILCIDEGVSFDAEEILDAHYNFLELGASDMVLQSNCGNDLHVELLMKAQSALRADHVRRAEVSKRLEEQQRTMLWPFVHRVMPGFPQLNKSYDLEASSKQIQCKLQAGTFGTVFKCNNVQNGQEEVVKVIRKNSLKDIKHVADIWQEILLMQRLEHPNVVAFKGAEHTRSDILIFMDYAGPRNLRAYIKDPTRALDIKEKISITSQILAGVAHCHEEGGIAHRDLKPENIVVTTLDDGQVHVRIVDFGLAVGTEKACTDIAGTIPFIAPEVVTRSDREQYDPACADIWACGVVFLEVLCGIGKINRMLQWISKPSSALQYREDLEGFFCIKNRITASVEADVGLVGGVNFPESANAALLGMLALEPTCRWNATTANEILTQNTASAVSD